MNKIIALILAFAAPFAHADATTSRLGGLTVPAVGSFNWGPKMNGNLYKVSTNTASQLDSNTFQSVSSNTFLGNVKFSSNTTTVWVSSATGAPQPLVGIGTTTPAFGLDIEGSALAVSSWTSPGSSLFVSSATGNVGVSTASPQHMFTVGNATMVVTRAGQVGLSTSTPTDVLSVAGYGNFTSGIKYNTATGTNGSLTASQTMCGGAWNNGIYTGGTACTAGSSGGAQLASSQTFTGANNFLSTTTLNGPSNTWVMVSSQDVVGVNSTTFTLTNFLYSYEADASSITWQVKADIFVQGTGGKIGLRFAGNTSCTDSISVAAFGGGFGNANYSAGGACWFTVGNNSNVKINNGMSEITWEFTTAPIYTHYIFASYTGASYITAGNVEEGSVGNYQTHDMGALPSTVAMACGTNADPTTVPNYACTYVAHVELWRKGFQHK